MGWRDEWHNIMRDWYGIGPMQEAAERRARDRRRAEIVDAIDDYVKAGDVLDDLARRIARNIKR